ncbi:trypsin-like serine protease [Streptomyces sp. XY431]|uniref:S1 family peptidase n=1 Tax=Streptomyces sp. XY431 TaxID=1415562 RepID=UPI0006AE5590|nr:trypsin-like serine protease [Streptomyces sp. XY431]
MLRSRSRSAWTTGTVTTVALTGALLAGTPAPALSGDAAPPASYSFTAKLDIGDGKRACTGALVDPYWIVTAASCFADDPTRPTTVPPGPPALRTTATVGRTDLTTTTGQVRDIAELVPRTDRDLVLARLTTPITDIAPVPLATATPVQGETLRVAGYGRTRTEWVPDRLHTAAFGVNGVTATGLAITGTAPAGAAVCKGDTGGPALRETNNTLQLVAVSSTSWQKGCLGSTETTRDGAVGTRVDDLGDWIRFVRSGTMPPQAPGVLRWFLSDSARSNVSTRAAFDFGKSPLIPLAGNWDGIGGDTPGAYDPTTAHFYLTNSLDGGPSTTDFGFGNCGDVPVVGRWDGGRTTEVGIYRPSTAEFHLRHHDGTVTSFRLGDGGNWKPIAGDWTHKGYDTPGLFNPDTATFYLVNSAHGGDADISFTFGAPGDTPITGDWNGSGTTQVGVYQATGSVFRFRGAAADGSSTYVYYGDGGFPVTGDWSGSGKSTQGIAVPGR